MITLSVYFSIIYSFYILLFIKIIISIFHAEPTEVAILLKYVIINK